MSETRNHAQDVTDDKNDNARKTSSKSTCSGIAFRLEPSAIEWIKNYKGDGIDANLFKKAKSDSEKFETLYVAAMKMEAAIRLTNESASKTTKN